MFPKRMERVHTLSAQRAQPIHITQNSLVWSPIKTSVDLRAKFRREKKKKKKKRGKAEISKFVSKRIPRLDAFYWHPSKGYTSPLENPL